MSHSTRFLTACSFAFIGLLLAPAVADAQCGVGLADFPVGCCNGTVAANCFGGADYGTECADPANPNQGCVWRTATSDYGCGDVTTELSVDPSGTNPRVCSCTGDCTNKQCGTDGCGLSCGTCAGNAYCGFDDVSMLDNQCICTPDCNGKFCGDDGCGGTCGACTGTDVCNDPAIGCETCQPDCVGKICGPDGCGGTCDGGFSPCFAGETCSADGTQCVQCVPDCNGKVCGSDGCGDNCGICNNFETCSTDQTQCLACVPQCTGANCGDDQCGGTCGTCAANEICTSGNCAVCTPDCTGKTCGDDGCGGSCGACATGTCTSTGQCDARYCSDIPIIGCCDSGSYLLCPSATELSIDDCASQGLSCGLDFNGNPACYDAFTVQPGGDCPAACVPDCSGKNCGDDGCGRTCGTCTGAGEFCNFSGQCEVCVPQCAGKECGIDFCGGSCGSCSGANDVCNADGHCEVPVRTCRDIPTGGCCEGGVYKQCDDGPQVQLRCTDVDSVCGSKWFGGFVGCWAADQVEGPKECGCIPQCDGKECGPDSCGGTCGECHLGQECTEAAQCEYKTCPDLPDARCCSGEVLSTCNLARGPYDVDCKSRNQYCGWDNDQGVFGCVDTPSLVDPDGAPRSCSAAPVCTPDCNGRTCGSDGCGGSCGGCGTDQTCDFASGSCIASTVCSALPPGGCCFSAPFYGVSVSHQLTCSSTDDYPSRRRCGQVPRPNGHGMVRATCGWDADEGRVGCIPYEPNNPHSPFHTFPSPPPGVLTGCPSNMCIPQCDAADQCGPDGCGGVCGVCSDASASCVPSADGTGGRCVTPCVASCIDRTCGSDGCGGSCGSCADNKECRELEGNQSTCVFVNRCNGIDQDVGCCSGPLHYTCDASVGLPQSERCGGSNTFCGWNDADQAYQCGRNNGAEDPSGVHPKQCPGQPAQTCQPYCPFAASCGDDGCGGSCGTCPGGKLCGQYGVCHPATCVDLDNTQLRWTTDESGCCDGNARAIVCGGQLTTIDNQEALKTRHCGTAGCGWSEQWQQYRCNVPGETPLPTEDPSGVHSRQCQEPQCVPDCRDNVCGDDGCGGSCGTCPGDLFCNVDQCESACSAVHTLSGKAYTDQGRCSYSTLYYCDYGTPTELNCAEQGDGLCGWNDQLNAYSCATTGQEGPTGQEPISNVDCEFPSGFCGHRAGCSAQAGACPLGTTCSELRDVSDVGFGTCVPDAQLNDQSCLARCGGTRAAGQCSCSAGCEVAGDCCGDYVFQCKGGPASAICTDGFCDANAGESCATCASDCGQCAADSAGGPPWNVPYQRIVVETAAGTKNQLLFSPLDDVLPTGNPVFSKNLQLHLSAARVADSVRGTTVLWDLDTNPGDSPGPSSVDGRVGQAMRFWEQTGTKPSHRAGEFVWRPDGNLPQIVNPQKKDPGGMSLAMWVKIPDNVDDHVINTLWTAQVAGDSVHNGSHQCTWPRKDSHSLNLSCPQIQGQQSWVQSIRLVAGDLHDMPVSPDGTCLQMRDHLLDDACTWDGADAFASLRCVGKSACTITLPDTLTGCENLTAPEFYVDAVCSTAGTLPTKMVSLSVLPAAQGHHLVLATPTETLESLGPVRPGQWHHVGFTFQPYTPNFKRANGIATLYLDGSPVKQNVSATVPRILYTTTASPPKAALNLSSSVLANSTLEQIGLIADIDDLFVYGRALSDNQFAALTRKGGRGLRQVWPANGAEHVVANDAGNANPFGLVPVAALHLIDPGAPGGSRLYQRSDPALQVPASRRLTFGAQTNHDLSGLNAYTMLAWVRASASTTELLSAGQTSTGDRLLVALDPTGSCGAQSVTATFADGTLAQNTCAHTLALGDWTLLALTQEAGGDRRVYLDAVQVGQTTVSNPAPLFDAQSGAPQVSFTGVDVFWAGVFERALPTATLAAWRRQGPVMWLDGKAYSEGGDVRLRDYALYQERGTPGFRPMLWSGGTPMTSAPSADGPLTFRKTPLEEFTVPANVYFPQVRGSEGIALSPRLFSIAARVGINGAGTYPLIERIVEANGLHQIVFRADAVCSSDTTCRLEGEALVAGPGVTSGQDQLKFVTNFFPLGGTANELDVALSFDGLHIYAALGALSNSAATTLTEADSLDVTETRQNRALSTAAVSAVASGTSFFRFSPKRATGNTLAFSELRLYPRAISPVEAVALSRRDCNGNGCEARGLVCQAGAGTALPSCGGCANNGSSAAPEATATCVPATQFMAQCLVDEECRTGLCRYGRCLERVETATCDAYCDALGRTCATYADGADSAFGCSGTCKANYRNTQTTTAATLNETLSKTLTPCIWSPQKQPGDRCASNEDCSVGSCVTIAEPTYNVQEINTCPANTTLCRQPADSPRRWLYKGNPATCVDGRDDYRYRDIDCPPVFPTVSDAPVSVGRCAAPDSESCTALNRVSIARRVTPPGQSVPVSTYACGGCLQQSYNGVPLYKNGFKIITPGLCKKALEQITADGLSHEYTHTTRGSFPEIDSFAQLLLRTRRFAKLTPRQFSDLQKMGVGPSPFSDAFWKPEHLFRGSNSLLAKKNLQFPLKYCGVKSLSFQRSGETLTFKSGYHDPEENGFICVPNKFPNGSPCPPPGANPTAGNSPHSFCESGFCARDTHLCEDGFSFVEENEGEGRADSKNGSGGFPINFTQNNKTTMSVKDHGTLANGTTKKRRYQLSSVNDNQLVFFGNTRSLLRLEHTLTSKPDEGNPTYSGKAFLFGLQIPTGTPATSCQGASFNNGEYVAPTGAECSAPIAAGKLSVDPPVVSLCLPNPLGCKDDAKGKPTGRGPMCVERTFLAGPIPITLRAEVALNVCLGVGAYFDSQTQEPSFRVVPSVGIGIEVRGGVGGSLGQIEAFAGVRALITILQLDFPISWGVRVAKKTTDPSGNPIENLYVVKFQRKIGIDITVLKLVMSLFAEVGISIAKVEWDLIVFQFGGLTFHIDLTTDDIQSRKIDFNFPNY